jgi:hypothetical protein
MTKQVHLFRDNIYHSTVFSFKTSYENQTLLICGLVKSGRRHPTIKLSNLEVLERDSALQRKENNVT